MKNRHEESRLNLSGRCFSRLKLNLTARHPRVTLESRSSHGRITLQQPWLVLPYEENHSPVTLESRSSHGRFPYPDFHEIPTNH